MEDLSPKISTTATNINEVNASVIRQILAECSKTKTRRTWSNSVLYVRNSLQFLAKQVD
jgi:hypothetical protein